MRKSRFVNKILVVSGVVLLSATFFIVGCQPQKPQTQVVQKSPAPAVVEVDPLPSWNDNINKERIISFVNDASNPSGLLFVPEKERIAAFDLDGTIFCEKPLYLQVQIAAERIYDLAEADPALREKEPYMSCWNRDLNYISDSANFLNMNLLAFEGQAEEEYKDYAMKFLTQKKNPDYNVPYIELFYEPMLELLKFLRDKKFKIFIVSGSPQEFIRAFSEDELDVEFDRVIGDTISVTFESSDSQVVFIRKPEVVLPEVLREGKAENIRMRVGRKPILAFGNSNDDIAMLEYASSGALPYLSLTLHHDDAEREYAYDKGADKVLQDARENDWAIVSMKEDFKTIFQGK